MLARPTLRRASCALLVVAVVAIAGCGGDDEEPATTPQAPAVDATDPPATDPATTPATAELNACELLPLDDAIAIAGGVELQPGEPIQETCGYTSDPTTTETAQVEIYYGDGAKKIYDVDVGLDHEFTTVEGIGDEAYQENGAIFFRKGTTWYAIRLVRLNDDAENVTPLQEGAKKVASRAP